MAARTRPRKQEQEDPTTEITEVAPGILRMQLPINFTGLGHVNCYALEDERGFAIVDPGLPGPSSWKALLDRLKRAGTGIEHVHSVIVTHSHPDHFGGAGKVRVEAAARVVTSSTFRTWFDPQDAADDVVEDPESAAADSLEAGASEEQVAPKPDFKNRTTPWGGKHPEPPRSFKIKMKLMRRRAGRWLLPPKPSVRLDDRESIEFAGREWLAVHTPGHTTDHLCLFDPTGGTLLAGDHVLPTITPHIAGHSGDSSDPLADFFTSLDKVAALPGIRQVLPAHGHPFTDLPGRVEDIKRHHEQRLGILREAAAGLGEATVEALSHELFRPQAWGAMAESETYAHLEHLRLSGEVTCRRVDGVLRYKLIA